MARRKVCGHGGVLGLKAALTVACVYEVVIVVK